MLKPGDRITWALGGLFYDGKPRVTMTGEVKEVMYWGYICFADGVPRQVTAAIQGRTRDFTFSVPFSDLVGGDHD